MTTCKPDGAVAIETDEVVTPRTSGTSTCRAGRHDGADHAGQRPRPHQAEHVRPQGSREPEHRDRRRAGATRSSAIGVTGKPFILAAGADLTGVPKLTDREQALDSAGSGHGVMRKLVDGGKPSFAFVNGVALGGGLEVALHAPTARSRRRPACCRPPRSSSA